MAPVPRLEYLAGWIGLFAYHHPSLSMANTLWQRQNAFCSGREPVLAVPAHHTGGRYAKVCPCRTARRSAEVLAGVKEVQGHRRVSADAHSVRGRRHRHCRSSSPWIKPIAVPPAHSKAPHMLSQACWRNDRIDHNHSQSWASRSTWSTHRYCTATRPSPSSNRSRPSGYARAGVAPLLATSGTPAAP